MISILVNILTFYDSVKQPDLPLHRRLIFNLDISPQLTSPSAFSESTHTRCDQRQTRHKPRSVCENIWQSHLNIWMKPIWHLSILTDPCMFTCDWISYVTDKYTFSIEGFNKIENYWNIMTELKLMHCQIWGWSRQTHGCFLLLDNHSKLKTTKHIKENITTGIHVCIFQADLKKKDEEKKGFTEVDLFILRFNGKDLKFAGHPS